MASPEQRPSALTPDEGPYSAGGSEAQEPKLGPPIKETPVGISYLGVSLDKAPNRTSQFVPAREQYADFINDAELALPLQRDIAVSWQNGDPLLIEGATSLGKTTTVRKMCAELGYEVHYVNLTGATDPEDLMGRYIPNPNKQTPGDPEYVFADGKVTSGLRREEGKTKVIILDELNAAAPQILIRLHAVIDALERNGDVVLSEDASEAVPVSKQYTKVVALMNPPGKGYFGREPLDPAQLRRWVYKKLPSQLPDKTFATATAALFGAAAREQTMPAESYLPARPVALAAEQLQEIPGLTDVLEKYKEFHVAAKKLVASRKLGADQPQPFTYDDRVEPRRVRDFVARFYTGDINETFQQALTYYYANKLENDADREKIGELIAHVAHTPKPVTSKRKGLETTPLARQPEGLVFDVEPQLLVQEALAHSFTFYREHNLRALADALPSEITLSKEDTQRMQEAREAGFDSAIVIPGSTLQSAHIEHLVEELAEKQHAGLAETQQYTEPYFESNTKTATIHNRPEDKPYLLLYQSSPVSPETKGKNPDELKKLFQEKGWNGLTLPEYLILQRSHLEQRKDHSFDAYDNDAEQSQWMWLLDSRVGADGVVDAHWGPGGRQVHVDWHGRVDSAPRLGARPAVVIEL